MSATLAFAQTAQPEPGAFNDEVKARVLQTMERILTTEAFVPNADFSKWPEMIEKRKDAIAEAASADEFVNAVNGALREFGFSHIVLYSPRFAQARTSRSMVGIGVRIQAEPNGLRVIWLFPQGPASKGGLEPGDLIVEADGKPVRQPGDLAGEESSKVNVTVERDGQRKTFELVREKFSTVIPEAITKVDESTAMVAIPTFDVGYNRNNVNQVMEEAMKYDNIILDLRGNGGGAVVNLLHLSSFFLKPDQPMGTFISRQTVNQFIRETGSDSTDLAKIAEWARQKVRPGQRPAGQFAGRVAVLINGGTGSASEIIAAALREHLGAEVIGSRSAGAVLASLMRPINDGFLLQYPVTDYVTIKGLRLEGNGVEPDVAAPLARYGEEDKAVTAAVAWFKRAGP